MRSTPEAVVDFRIERMCPEVPMALVRAYPQSELTYAGPTSTVVIGRPVPFDPASRRVMPGEQSRWQINNWPFARCRTRS